MKSAKGKFAVLNRVFASLFATVFAVAAHACLWDNDTLEAEAKGNPDTIAVITGRFERNPDLFYTMRLQRVTKGLQSTPDKLEFYDDAAVACDRLHRGDEAIAWMEKKRSQMEKLRSSLSAGVLREQRYRYCANLGTFVAHRWLRSGANRKQISEMKRARNLIAEAIKINPDAHFRREKYQLKVMDWIINPPKWDTGAEFPDFIGLSHHLEILEDKVNRLEMLEQEDAIKSLRGLITLGDAWQSVDTFYTLKLALMLKGDTSAAFIAQYRLQELIEMGKGSLHPDAPRGEDLKLWIAPKSRLGMGMWLTPRYPKREEIQHIFKSLRKEADSWHAQRTAYMMERLEAGRHPDTDKTFWNEWTETPAPSLHVPSLEEKSATKNYYLELAFIAAGVLFIGCLALRFAKKRGQ